MNIQLLNFLYNAYCTLCTIYMYMYHWPGRLEPTQSIQDSSTVVVGYAGLGVEFQTFCEVSDGIIKVHSFVLQKSPIVVGQCQLFCPGESMLLIKDIFSIIRIQNMLVIIISDVVTLLMPQFTLYFTE